MKKLYCFLPLIFSLNILSASKSIKLKIGEKHPTEYGNYIAIKLKDSTEEDSCWLSVFKETPINQLQCNFLIKNLIKKVFDQDVPCDIIGIINKYLSSLKKIEFICIDHSSCWVRIQNFYYHKDLDSTFDFYKKNGLKSLEKLGKVPI